MPPCSPGPAGAAPVTLTPAEKAAAARITPEILRSHVRFLSDDLLEGRGPASRGDRLTQLHIATRLEALGLQPAAPDGSWYQPFDIVGVTSHSPQTLAARRAGESVELKYHQDFIAVAGVQEPQARLADAEIVFVGYGIVAPEYGWNDYKDMDLKGKVLLVMNNDPEDDPNSSRARAPYTALGLQIRPGREDGAAGHHHPTTPPRLRLAGIQTSWTGEQFCCPRRRPQLR